MVTDVYKYLALKIVTLDGNDCFWQLFFECMNFANLSHWSSTKLRNLLYPIYLLYTKKYFIPSFYCIQNHTLSNLSTVYKTNFIRPFYCIQNHTLSHHSTVHKTIFVKTRMAGTCPAILETEMIKVGQVEILN